MNSRSMTKENGYVIFKEDANFYAFKEHAVVAIYPERTSHATNVVLMDGGIAETVIMRNWSSGQVAGMLFNVSYTAP